MYAKIRDLRTDAQKSIEEIYLNFQSGGIFLGESIRP